MKFTMKKRIFAAILTCVLWTVSCGALADQVLVTASSNVYATPGDTSSTICTLSEGTILNRVAQRSGWSMVTLNGVSAYMTDDALATVTAMQAVGYTTAETNLLATPAMGGKVLEKLSAGTKVLVGGVAGNWAYVCHDGNIGYVTLSALTDKAPAAQTDSGITYTNLTMYVAKDGAKVYNTSGNVVGTLSLNTVVTVTAYNDDLAMTDKGILYKSDLSASKTETASGITYISATTFYVAKDGAKVYNASGKALGTLSLNTAVTVTAYNDELALTDKGILYKSDLSATKTETQSNVTYTNTTAYVAKDNAKVYNTKGKVIGTLDLNTAVTVTAISGELAMTNAGIMYISDLSDKQVSTNSITYITATTYYVQKDGATVYNAKGTAIGTLSLNTAVSVTAYNDTLALVSVNGTKALMSRSDLATSKVVVTIKRGDSGEAVVKIQQRLKELGWFGGSTAGNYLDLTVSAVKSFQKASGLTASGECDAATLSALFSDSAAKYTIPSGSNAQPATGTAKEMDWWTSDIQSIFSRGTVATITDVATGIAWKEKRTGGTNHADCQPCTAADTAAMKSACGSWSWARRAIFVTINGVNYAASMNCMPHGSGDSITDNNFDGHHCIHFTNSRTHGTNSVCQLHQKAIKKAASTTL